MQFSKKKKNYQRISKASEWPEVQITNKQNAVY